MNASPLTEQQQKVLDFIGDHSHRTGFPPTLREIGDALGLPHVNAVRGHVTALEKKGYITRTADKARSIRVVAAQSAMSRFKRKLHEVFRTDEGVVHRIVFGLAWATWKRESMLTGRRRDLIGEALDREAGEHGWRLVQKRVAPDHVVLVVEVWPNHSAELAVRRFQSAGRAVKKGDGGEFSSKRLWDRGYVATTDLELLDQLVEEMLSPQGTAPKDLDSALRDTAPAQARTQE